MKHFALLFIFPILLGGLGAVTKTFLGGSVWNASYNWSPAGVPTASDDVIIPSALSAYPDITSSGAECNNLTINTGAQITLVSPTAPAVLNVYGNLTCYGTITISDISSTSLDTNLLHVRGNMTLNSTAALTCNNSDATVRCERNLTLNSGSNFSMSSGTAVFSENSASSRLTNASVNTQFRNLRVEKAHPQNLYITSATSQDFVVAGELRITNGSYFLINDAAYTKSVIVRGSVNDLNTTANGGLVMNSGTLVLDGTSPWMSILGPSSYLKHLLVSTTGTSNLNADLKIKGNLTIESGVFNAGTRTIEIGGNWSNTVGLAAFNEGTSRVIFNGSEHQFCNYDETFYTLEVNKTAGALRPNNGATVTCAHYDWTQGAVDVQTGSAFTANDLTDNGIYGSYYVNPGGTINLSNHGALVDLNGSLIFTDGGSINVYGGSSDSYWSYSNDALITMNAGTLDFKTVGINVAASAHAFTENISGGMIRTAGNFACNRTTFTPSGGMVELYGTANSSLSHVSGSYLHSLTVIKSLASGTVTLASPLVCKGNVNLNGGVLDVSVSNHQISVAGNWSNGTGSAGFTERAGRVVFNSSSAHQYCNFSETFYILELNVPGYSLRVDGSAATVVTCAQYDWTAGGLDIREGTFTANDLTDNGPFGSYYCAAGGILNLTNTDGRIDLNGLLNITGGEVNIHGGTADARWPYYGNASLTMSSGSLNYHDRGIYIYNSPSYTFAYNITGGTISTVGTLTCNRTDFNPGGGTFKFVGNAAASINFAVAGSSFHNLAVEKTAATVTLSSNIDINGDLNLNSGTLNSGSRTINLAGNWNRTLGVFTELNSTVVFDGDGYQTTSAWEDFYNLTVNKSAGTLSTPDPDELWWELHVNNNLLIQDGTMNAWMDLYAQNITIAEGACLDPHTVYLWGNLTDNNTLESEDVGLQPAYFEISGGTASTITRAGGLTLFINLLINKSAGVYCYFGSPVKVGNLTIQNGIWRDLVINLEHLVGDDLEIGPNGVFDSSTQNTVTTFSSHVDVYINNPATQFYNFKVNNNLYSYDETVFHTDITILNAFDVVAGWAQANANLTCLGDITVSGTGIFDIDDAQEIRLGNGSTLLLQDGGALLAYYGPADEPTLITSVSGYYNLVVATGGIISTRFVIFEKMTSVNVQPGGIVEPEASFNECTFRDGQPGQPLLIINNSQNVYIAGANFPANNWGSACNVSKTVNSGTVTFVESRLEFSGQAFEQDPYSRVAWLGSLPPVDGLEITHDPATNTVTLYWEWNHSIPARAFNVYANQTGATTDSYYFLESVPGTGRQFSETAFGKRFYKVTAVLY